MLSSGFNQTAINFIKINRKLLNGRNYFRTLMHLKISTLTTRMLKPLQMKTELKKKLGYKKNDTKTTVATQNG